MHKKIILVTFLLLLTISFVFLLPKNTPEKFTISYIVDDVLFDSKIIDKNQTVIKPVDPIKEGYRFLGWYLDDTQFDFKTPIIKDLELHAKWAKTLDPFYRITLDIDGIKATQKTNQKGFLLEPGSPSKDGYKFMGWYQGDTKADFSKPFSSDTTIVAKWDKEEIQKVNNPNTSNSNKNASVKQEAPVANPAQYTVTFMVDDIVYQTTMNQKGDKLELPANPIKDGYTFNGWYNGEDIITGNMVVNEDMIITANWDSYTFKLELIKDIYAIKAYKNGSLVESTYIYGEINENHDYLLGVWDEDLKTIVLLDLEAFKQASNYKLKLSDETIVLASKIE